MANPHHEIGGGILYWFFWSISFVFAKSTGAVNWVSGKLPDIEIPIHDVRYLPQLHEFIPSAITAIGCGVLSLAVTSALKWAFFRLFPSLKSKSDA